MSTDEKAAAAFKVGDVVRAKSGGPVMTVDHVTNQVIYCVWFDARCMLQVARVPPATLEIARKEG